MKRTISVILSVLMILSVIVFTPLAASAETNVLIPTRADWKYILLEGSDHETDPDTNHWVWSGQPEGWLDDGFDDRDWDVDPAPFTGSPYPNAVGQTNTGISLFRLFLRKEFTVSDLSEITHLTMNIIYDENPTVYINGHEVWYADGYKDTVYTPVNLDGAIPYLREGSNVVEVAIGNNYGGQVFDLSLLATVEGLPYGSFEAQSVWQYVFLTGGTTLEAPTGFHTGGTVEGLLEAQGAFANTGTAVQTVNTYFAQSGNFTAYFRKAFRIDDPSLVTKMKIRFLYDEDPEVWINGTSVWSTTGYHDSGYTTIDLSSYIGLLNAGTNYISARICNAYGGTCFDMALDCTIFDPLSGDLTPTGATCSGFVNFGEINNPANVLDGDETTVCGSGFNSGTQQYITVTLDGVHPVNQIKVQCKNEGTTPNADGSRGTYSIYAILNGTETLIAENVPAYTGTAGGYTVDLETPVNADAIKVLITSWQGDCWACLADIFIKQYVSAVQTENITLGKFNTGWENYDAGNGTQVQLLLTVKDEYGNAIAGLYDNRNNYVWELTITDENDETTVIKTLKPASYYGDGIEIYRFETAVGNVFVPAAGAHDYTVNLRILINDQVKYNSLAAVLTSTPADFTPVHEHDYGEWTTTSAASCTENGTKQRVCTACGAIEYAAIPAIGHNYTAPVFTWDHGNATAAFVCTKCKDEQELTVNTTSFLISQPDCTTAGERLYIATVILADPDRTYNDMHTEKIPATGHTVDSETGVCALCGEVFGASVEKDGSVFYLSSFDEALEEVNENGKSYVITLYGDESVGCRMIAFPGAQNVSVTLDLNGNTIVGESDEETLFFFPAGCTSCALTVRGGTLLADLDNDNARVFCSYGESSGNAFILEESLTVNSSCCAVLVQNGDSLTTGAVITVTGEHVFAIAGMGGQSGSHITICGGSVTASGYGSVAVYHPQAGELSITGGRISGATALYVKSGSVTVSGEETELVGTGRKFAYAYNDNGCMALGNALVVENCDYGSFGAPSVSLQAGSFLAGRADALASYAYGAAGESANEPLTGFVSGGVFSSEVPYEWCAGELASTFNARSGKFEIAPHTVHLWKGGEVLSSASFTHTGLISGGVCEICKRTASEAETVPAAQLDLWYSVETREDTAYAVGTIACRAFGPDSADSISASLTVKSGGQTVRERTVTITALSTVVEGIAAANKATAAAQGLAYIPADYLFAVDTGALEPGSYTLEVRFEAFLDGVSAAALESGELPFTIEG